ncbi:hypothetical protein Ga0074812_11823 [Parafrankia irregularis]|uniref:PIN like domain-containing protein n=1 Tax=Parafrankia irregularis TaxID=795642 RepID=A0A0S4QR81_9ACTN|nr:MULTISPECIES: PIN-like domain-containing protein [Parafrankia]MBE3201772.1 hypothetical protein [Parafrankia sp. CH37]CUU58251.1 hypothetical protein Ga0074812_11823 [Parafrankia irregularis]
MTVTTAPGGQLDQRLSCGLFDGFEAFRTPSDDDFRFVFSAGLVVPDTNVLLNLYRYSSEARDSLLSVLQNLGSSLWVPHQVISEFWSVRDSVLRDPRGTLALTTELDKLQARAEKMISEWARERSLSPGTAEDLRAGIEAAFDAAIERIGEFDDGGGTRYLEDSAGDPVVTALADILAGKVGAKPTQDVLEARIATGHERVAQEIPPGYKDKGKPGNGPVGDFLLWCELLEEAKRRDCNALFVTSDVKEDWWRRVGEAPRGPRPELVREMRQQTGRALFMMQPDGLLERARSLLNVDVSESSLENVERVQQFEVAKQAGDEWAAEAVAAVLDRLSEEAPVQAQVLRRAAELGGFINRDDVYRIGNYDSTRSLRGFTRPVRRIVQAFQDRGLIPGGVDDLLQAVYDDETVGLATGFSVPRSALPLVLEWADPQDAPA